MAKIAVIEDDLPIADMYRLKLERKGHKVIMAYDGDTGLEILEKFKPALVLLDLLLPGMNGEDILEKMRATDWGSKIRVIVLTNISKDEAPSKLRLLSVDRYIVKAHYTPRQVVEVVEEILGEKSS